MLSDTKKLTDLQIALYNDIMSIAYSKAKLVEAVIKINRSIRNDKKESFVKSKTDNDIRLKNKDDFTIYIESEIQESLEKQEMIEMQIEYLDSTSKVLNNLIWGIKYRIESERINENI